MAGIYIHIPFCKQACHYCNFHFSTSLQLKNDFLQALLLEIRQQKDYLSGAGIKTIYFGGGTPSLLSGAEIEQILGELKKQHPVHTDSEITLEANPDDLNPNKLEALHAAGINRLSIGVQSFEDNSLAWMNRAHNAQEAKSCILDAQKAGIDNLTIDLIYGVPRLNDDQWHKNILTAIELGVPHISAYSLTVEPKTALETMIRQGKKQSVDEIQSARQFEILIEIMEQRGYIHYEISNFCLADKASQHNSNYWKGVPYLGLGASAHSFDGNSRQWNVANNTRYVKSVLAGSVEHSKEQLSSGQRINEYLMTSLRTIWGCDLEKIKAIDPIALTEMESELNRLKAQGFLKQEGQKLFLTHKAKFLADGIISDLFIVEDE